MTTDLRSAVGQCPLIAILRRCPPQHVLALALAAVEAGVRVVEITLDSESALDQIATVAAASGAGVVVAAGTVRRPEQVAEAARAGATVVVCPVMDEAVAAAASAAGVEVVLAGFTPTELDRASRAGSGLVKLFPAGALGAGYVRSLRGPLPELEVLVTGGVPLAQVPDYLRAGARAVGLGSELFTPAVMANGDARSVELALREVQDLLRTSAGSTT